MEEKKKKTGWSVSYLKDGRRDRRMVYGRSAGTFLPEGEKGAERFMDRDELKAFLESLAPGDGLWNGITFPLYAAETAEGDPWQGPVPEDAWEVVDGRGGLADNPALYEAITVLPPSMDESEGVLETEQEEEETASGPAEGMAAAEIFEALKKGMELLGDSGRLLERLDAVSEERMEREADILHEIELLPLEDGELLSLASELKKTRAEARKARDAASAVRALFGNLSEAGADASAAGLAFAKCGAWCAWAKKADYRLATAEGTIRNGMLYMDADYPAGIPPEDPSGNRDGGAAEKGTGDA